jgi:hypothetical protein
MSVTRDPGTTDYATLNPPYEMRVNYSGLKFMATPLMQ